jgi:hypothetical protein
MAFETKEDAEKAKAALRAVFAKGRLPGRRRLNLGGVAPLHAPYLRGSAT